MYNKKEIFEKEIEQKASELYHLCQRKGVVCFMSFCISDNEKETKYQNYMFGSRSNNIRLTDDQIRHHINVANGFETIPPNASLSSDIDDMFSAIGEAENG